MADKEFVVKNGIIVNTHFAANSTSLTSNGFSVNSTSLTSNGFSANSTSLASNGFSVNSTALTSNGFSVNSTALTSNGFSVDLTSLNSNGFSVNSTALTSNGFSVNSTSINVSFSFSANSTRFVVPTTVGIEANGNIGTANQLLVSNGTTVYWANDKSSNAYSNALATVGTNFASLANSVNFTNTSITITSNAVLVNNQSATIGKGFNLAPYNAGVLGPANSITLNANNGNYQYLVVNGNITITAPTTNCAIDILTVNGTNAGSITFSGFTTNSIYYGDVYTNTASTRHILSVRRINSNTVYVWKQCTS